MEQDETRMNILPGLVISSPNQPSEASRLSDREKLTVFMLRADTPLLERDKLELFELCRQTERSVDKHHKIHPVATPFADRDKSCQEVW